MMKKKVVKFVFSVFFILIFRSVESPDKYRYDIDLEKIISNPTHWKPGEHSGRGERPSGHVLQPQDVVHPQLQPARAVSPARARERVSQERRGGDDATQRGIAPARG